MDTWSQMKQILIQIGNFSESSHHTLIHTFTINTQFIILKNKDTMLSESNMVNKKDFF